MKAVNLLLISILSAFAPTQAAAGWKDVGRFLGAQLPSATFPAVENITGMKAGLNGRGFQLERYNVVFRNAAELNATAVIVVYEKEVAWLKPGQIAVDNRLTQMHLEQIPVMVFYYQNSQDDLLGVSWAKINFYPGVPQSQPLLFDRIVRSDGSTVQPERKTASLSLSASELKEGIVHMPRKWLDGTVGLQIANISSYLTRISINGHTIALLRPGSFSERFVYFEKTVVEGWGVNSVQVDYFREINGGYEPVLSLYDVPLNLQSWGIYSRQLIIGAPTVGYITN